MMDFLFRSFPAKDPYELSKARLLVYSLLGGILLPLSSFFIEPLLGIYVGFPAIPLAFISLSLLLLFMELGSTKIVGNLFVFILYSIFINMTFFSGGIFSEDLQFIFFVPLLAFLIVGIRSGIFWLALCFAWDLYLLSKAADPEQMLLSRRQTLAFPPIYYFAFVVLSSLLSIVIFRVTDKENNRLASILKGSREKLKENNQLMLKQKKELVDAQSALERSNLELQQYAYVASHDLKQPIRTISSFATLLKKHQSKKERTDEKSHEYFQFILSGTNHMNELVTDLLDYAKLSSVEELKLTPMPLDFVVNQVIQKEEHKLTEQQGSITKESLPEVKVAPQKINAVFHHLIGNAIKFKKPEIPLKLHIYGQDQGDQYQISIKDNGIGIEDRFISQIFTPFKQLHEKNQYAGTGIGLATCKRIMELHKGEIWAESTIDVGTCVHLVFPK